MKKEIHIIDRKLEGFIIPDDMGLVGKGAIVQPINEDGSSDRTLIVGTTEVHGAMGYPGFIVHINTNDQETGEEVILKPGQRIKYLGETEEIIVSTSKGLRFAGKKEDF